MEDLRVGTTVGISVASCGQTGIKSAVMLPRLECLMTDVEFILTVHLLTY